MLNPTQRGPFGWRHIVPQPVMVDEELEAIEETQVPFLKTKSFGTTHTDTIQFDDVQYFNTHIWAKLRDGDVNSWRIRGIRLFGNRYANGIQVLSPESPQHDSCCMKAKKSYWKVQNTSEIIMIQRNLSICLTKMKK